MDHEAFIDLSPADERWGHQQILCNHVNIHFVRQGKGKPVLMLHGWPGFWYDWRSVIPLVAPHADVICPDFRGFGYSEKPDISPAEGYTPQVLAQDMISLIEQLDLKEITLVAHDIGATVAQALVRLLPERIDSVLLLNPPYPGIGARRFDPSVQGEFWYQHFHALPWAEDLIGHDRKTVSLYLAHFYDHWVGNKEAIRPNEFEHIVDVYAAREAFKWSIAYYRARAGARSKEAAANPATLRISHRTKVLWGTVDPVMLSVWSDRLKDYFADVDVELLDGIGHFVPVEAPTMVAKAILESR